MAFVYWSGNYWNASYWQEDYWQEVANVTEAEPDTATLTLTALAPQVALDSWDYFSDDYFQPNYWQNNYWSESNAGGGAGNSVDQNVAGSLSLTSFAPFIEIELQIFPATDVLTLTAYDTDTANDVTVTAEVESLTLTTFDPSVDNAGYVLADIDVSVFVSSAFSFTDGANVTLETLTLSAQSPVGVDYDTNVTVNVDSTGELTLTAFPVTARNTVSVNPLTPSLTLTEYATTAGFGDVVRPNVETLTLNSIQTSVTAVSQDVGQIFVPTPTLSLNGLQAAIEGVRRLPAKPPSTFVIDQIINNTATTNVPNNYLICDRSGFRVKVSEGLREEWDGTMVRAKSYESRHPQDFVRSRPSSLTGSKRPEQEDEFISDRFPAGVTADDL